MLITTDSLLYAQVHSRAVHTLSEIIVTSFQQGGCDRCVEVDDVRVWCRGGK